MIVFPLDLYPLDDTTKFIDENNTVLDKMDDGSPRLRTLGAQTHRTIRCVFGPMYGDESTVFEQYIRDNRAELFNIVVKGKTYQGYIASRVKPSYFDGDVVKPTFDFMGTLV